MSRRLALPTFALLAGALMTASAQAQTALPQQNSRPGQPTAEAQTKGSHERHATGTTAPNQDAQNQTRAQRRQGGAQGQPGQVQQVQAGARRNSVAPAAGAVDAGAADAELAACFQISNQSEVDAANFALQKTQNEEVKKFAQQMVQDHGKMIQDLAKFAGNRSVVQQTSAAQPQGAAQNVRQAGGMPQQQGVIDHVAFKQQLAEQCKQTMQRELGEKSGAEFDMCYVGAQIHAHLHAIDAMRVAQNYASPELRQALDQGIQTASTHLEHAKDLAKKMQAQSGGSEKR